MEWMGWVGPAPQPLDRFEWLSKVATNELGGDEWTHAY
jgi:hypothetical protein